MPKVQQKKWVISATGEEDLNALGYNLRRMARYAGIAEYNLLRRVDKSKRSKFAKLLMSRCMLVNGRFKNTIATTLHYAVMTRNIENVRFLIDRGACVNARSAMGCTPLHYAIRSINTTDIALLLLQNGADIYRRNDYNLRPVHLAIENGSIHIFRRYLQYSTAKICRHFNILHKAIAFGHTDTVKWLLSEDIDIDMQDENGRSPLHVAVERNDIQLVKLLLDRGASLNSVNACRNGYTPVHVACQNGLNEMVELLLQKGADVDSAARNQITPMYIATSLRNYNMIKLLLNHNANVDVVDGEGAVILDLAVKNGDLPLVDQFLSRYPDINDCSIKKLFKNAVESGSKKIIKLLVERGFDINAPDTDGYSGLHYIALSNESPSENDSELCARVDVADLLLREGADINATTEKDLTPLHLSILNRCGSDIVEFLLANGANVNYKNYRGRTPLHYAAVYGTTNICQLLLEAGADVNSREDKLTGLHLANPSMRKVVVSILLEYGVDIHSNNEGGSTPLHFAAHRGSEGISDLLLNSGADVNAKDHHKCTPLHLAVQEEYKNVVQILLEHGADVNSQNEDGHTALHLAAKSGHVQITEILLNFGADIESADENGDPAVHLAFRGRHEEVVRILIKMHVFTLPMKKDKVMGLNIVPIMKEYPEFVLKCVVQAAIMECVNIGNTDITVHNIVTKRINELASYATNEEIVRFSRHSNEYELMFSEYANMIKVRFDKIWNERSC